MFSYYGMIDVATVDTGAGGEAAHNVYTSMAVSTSMVDEYKH